ncbi:MAG: nuclear transport factor 2 family protein [Acidobacteria bacterium]|nr:nuclear transport factor 2 family protein [Acidobacteriota bacterium]
MNATINNQYNAVAQAVRTYYDGLYHGDTSALRSVFHPDARYVTASSGELLQLDMNAYFPKVEARQSPESLGEPYGYTLESIEIARSTAASVRLRSSMLGKHFIDFLSMINVDGKWRIISKVFDYQEQDPPAESEGE